MRKLLKFAAPILILALIFASCDDRGKNPGGSTSDGITVQVALPAGLYDGAAWQMSLAAREDAEPIEAKSVSFVPAKDAEGGKALVIGTGFSEEAIATGISGVTVTYTLQNGSVYQASATPSGMGDIMSKTISAEVASGAWKSKTPQTITLTVTGLEPASSSEDDIAAAQLKTTGWTITMAEDSKAPIAVADYEAKVTKSAADSTAAVVSIAFSAGKNSIPDGTYTATVQYGTGDGMLQGSSASTISVEAGQTNPGAAAVQLNPTNGQIAVTMPATLPIQEDGKNVPTSSASISYILTPGSASPVSIPASAIATNAFTISGLEVPSEAVTYSLTVIATYKGADYVVSSKSVTGPTSVGATATADLSKESFAGISLQVTLAVGSNSGLTLASLPKAGWAVAYTECDSKGNPLAGATAATFTMPSDSPSASGQFTIAGLKYGAQYLVSAALETENTIYSGSGYNSTATAAGSSNSASVQLLITGGAVPFGSSGIAIQEASIQFGVDSGLTSLSSASANTLKIGGSFTGAESGAIAISGSSITVKGSISASDLGKALPLTGTITATEVYTLENSFVTFYQSKTGVISARATITTGEGIEAE